MSREYWNPILQTLDGFWTNPEHFISSEQQYCILKMCQKWNIQTCGHFKTISGNFFCQINENLLQNWGSDNHFEVLNGSKS